MVLKSLWIDFLILVGRLHKGGRRGALMITISVHHPQISDFIKIKHLLTRVTGANISIKLSDEFMCAVEDDTDVELRFPVDSDDPEMKKMIRAKDLWEEIIESAHKTAEPGTSLLGHS